MRRSLIRIVSFLIINLGKVFYKDDYISGKYFERNSLIGCRWIFKGIIFQKILGLNRNVPWPVAHTILINNWRGIIFHPDDLHIFQTGGSYFQAQDAKIVIGKGTWIAPNVGLITTNHNINNLEEHVDGKDIILGEQCWVGMNAVILPGVTLGPNTIVGAGAVVTKSFPEGYSVIGGVPAALIKKIDRSNEGEN